MNSFSEKSAVCDLCHHSCRLAKGQIGICGVRRGTGEAVESLVYGKVVAENIDPIEKKPLFHVLPGSLSYSIATPGCNFRCLNCQNSSISQVKDGLPGSRTTVYRSPEEIVDAALASGCKSLSYTYVEPTVFFEFAYDCAVLAKERGLGNIFVSNGYMSEKVVQAMAPVLTAINIDLKSWDDGFYRKVCGARLEPVLDNIRRFVDSGVWVEVTTLIIPEMNNSEKELRSIANFLAGVDRNIPWHVSAFYPAYKMMDKKMTRPSDIDFARQIGRDCGLPYVYGGNIRTTDGMATLCPDCGLPLIVRNNFIVNENRLVDGACPSCQAKVAGMWQLP
ncbi:AmmeMemoRadiSam system radical SAM enzyme [Desulforhopalus sp. IMCC35007]|uniref:AmmeMemoRadiSam system radical SAM enzyme n=1 Tax=Desulforhopalus sp. IMCC35007 TaxID=2569543 RepID=UPI001F0CF171|nr:AmmeMemoRadiSam system radical SAM enzyme [Desulforhopalus sp. IMCC35007]